MASGVSFKMKMKGHREAMAKFARLDRKMKRSIADKALRAGAKVMAKAIKAAIPGSGKAARKAIGTKIKTYRSSSITVAITGERIESRARREKEQKSRWGGPHLHLIERGTAERFHTGERESRRAKRDLAGIATPETLQAVLESTGAFGRFGAEVRAAQDRSRGQITNRNRNISRRRARFILREIAKGRPTGRVRAKPFFVKTVKATTPASQAAQLAVMRRELDAAVRAA